MAIILYVSSVSSNTAIKKHTQKIQFTLQGQGIDYSEVDVAVIKGAKEKMRELCGDATAVPPQIFNEDTYCGTFEQFMEAIEDSKLYEFLKLPPPPEAAPPAEAPTE